MFVSVSAIALGLAIAFSPLGIVASPVIAKQAAPSGPGNDFMGSLTWYPQNPDLLLATISNNSTVKYAVLAKNNLFDDAHPFAPLQVTDLSGTPITLVGSRWSYTGIDDTQFKDFPPGAVWQRYFNMSEYLPPSTQYKTPTSQCLAFALPPTVEALNKDQMTPNQHLADLFLSKGITEVTVDANPIHMNATVPPSTGTAAAAGAAQPIPTEPSGIILPASQQSGAVINLLEGSQPSGALDGNSFVVGGSSSLSR